MKQEERKKLYLDFMQGLQEFTENVHLLTQDTALPNQQKFLKNIARDVNHLYESCVEVSKCHDDDADEIGGIIQSIFEQPLAIEKKLVTIIKAAKEFSETAAEESDLSHIMREYVKHPETTRSFIRELQILTKDMQEIVKEIA